MTRPRFVTPSLTRLLLSDGDWIDVKTTLNTAETRTLMARSAPVLGEKRTFDAIEYAMARVLGYLAGRSLTNGDGAPVPYSLDLSAVDREAVLGNLHPLTWTEIRDAIDTHINAAEAASSAEKNGQSGATASKATSPLPDASAGATNGSENLTQTSTAS